MLIIATVFAITTFSIPNNTVKIFSAVMGVAFVIAVAVDFCPSYFGVKVNCAEKRRKILVEKQMNEVAKELGF